MNTPRNRRVIKEFIPDLLKIPACPPKILSKYKKKERKAFLFYSKYSIIIRNRK